jgi:hypothetical protein
MSPTNVSATDMQGERHIEEVDSGHMKLSPSVTSVPSNGPWVSGAALGVALTFWILLAQGTSVWLIGAAVAAIWGGSFLYDTWKWIRTRSLRRDLGEFMLSVDSHPAIVGEPFATRMTQHVRSVVHVRSVTMQLHCDVARLETYGIYDRKQTVWYRDFEVEMVTLREQRLQPGDELNADAATEIPVGVCPSSTSARWWILVETSIDGCPPYSTAFPLEVVRPHGDTDS